MIRFLTAALEVSVTRSSINDRISFYGLETACGGAFSLNGSHSHVCTNRLEQTSFEGWL